MSADPNDSHWIVVEYEVQMMISATQFMAAPEKEKLPFVFRNGVTELAILHARKVVDFLLSLGTGEDDVTLDKLLPDCDPEGVMNLRTAYGDEKTQRTPCWQFNRLLTQATTQRGTTHDCAEALNALLPHILRLLKAILGRRPNTNFNVPD